MRRAGLILVCLASLAAGQAMRKPVDGFFVGLHAGYWMHAGASQYFDNGFGGGVRTGYRFDGGELELAAFFEYTYLMLTDDWEAFGADATGALMVFGITPRISFFPQSWISPFISAGPALQIRSSSLALEQPADGAFGYQYDAINLAAKVEFGVEFPLQPNGIIEVGVHYTHCFTAEEERFAGMVFGAGYSLYF